MQVVHKKLWNLKNLYTWILYFLLYVILNFVLFLLIFLSVSAVYWGMLFIIS